MAWPPELDAVVAAPEHHRLAFENESVRVLETRIEPGETTRLHTHECPAATYVLSWADCVRRDADGNVMMDTRDSGVDLPPGAAVWTPSLEPHTLENVGARPIHVVTVEVKPRG